MTPTVSVLLEEASHQLACAELVEARREAQVLLGHALGKSRAWLSAHSEDQVDPSVVARFRQLVQRRLSGEPVAYIVGRKEFYGLEFRVTPDVLIPRADTETLVDAALARMSAAGCDVLDLGTGSGCIAIAIAHERPAARVMAVDVSSAALSIARENALANAVDVQFLQASWFEALDGRRFDIIVSNPPYVATEDPHLQQGDLRFEPAIALAGGNDGLADIRLIVAKAPSYLRDQGWLLFEHGHTQACDSRNLLANAGFQDITHSRDIAGLVRVAGGRLLS
ncbi:MAG TPA: peptide chain release factor N(5)-glutamine methyltransferase [Burkholderiales bacterium]|nr:peptide chain release factor N(5)-glutamine methyltransferase [Burkholderiales bacterium]